MDIIVLGAHVSPGNPETAVVMNSLCPYFISRGAGPVLATQRAYSVLFRKIDRQASMLAYTTAFRLLGVMFLGMIPFIMLMKRPAKKGSALVAH